jgi:hypothetical protein
VILRGLAIFCVLAGVNSLRHTMLLNLRRIHTLLILA